MLKETQICSSRNLSNDSQVLIIKRKIFIESDSVSMEEELEVYFLLLNSIISAEK